MTEVLVDFGWNYVSVVHTEGDYESTGYEALLGHARNDSRVCLADPLVIQDKDDNYDDVTRIVTRICFTRMIYPGNLDEKSTISRSYGETVGTKNV